MPSKPFKVNGCSVTPNFDWSPDFRKHYSSYLRNLPGNVADEGTYRAQMERQNGWDTLESRERLQAQYELAKRPKVLEAVTLIKDDRNSTAGLTVYRKQPVFHLISERNR